MSVDNNELGFKANKLIMDAALRGGCGDSIGGIQLCWKAVGRYMVVYIENLDAHETYYRVFRFPGKPYYEYKLIMRPSYTAEDYLCVYDSKENAKGRTMLQAKDLEWMDRVRDETYS